MQQGRHLVDTFSHKHKVAPATRRQGPKRYTFKFDPFQKNVYIRGWLFWYPKTTVQQLEPAEGLQHGIFWNWQATKAVLQWKTTRTETNSQCEHSCSAFSRSTNPSRSVSKQLCWLWDFGPTRKHHLILKDSHRCSTHVMNDFFPPTRFLLVNPEEVSFAHEDRSSWSRPRTRWITSPSCWCFLLLLFYTF